MVDFVAVLQAAQDGNRIFNVGLADVDDLEATRQRGVFFDVLAIFVQRGGADGAQIAPGQRRFQHVRGVNGALGGAGANQRVQLVDEENDSAVALFDVLEHGLQTIFKLAAIFCPGQHGRQVERHHAFVFQLLGDIAGDDALRQTFNNGRLAHAGFANQYRIVLGAPRKHLDGAPNLLVAANHGIELSLPGEFGQITRVALQRLILCLRIRVGDRLRSAHCVQRFQDGVMGRTGRGQQVARRVALQLGHRQQQVLRRDILVFEIPARLLS